MHAGLPGPDPSQDLRSSCQPRERGERAEWGIVGWGRQGECGPVGRQSTGGGWNKPGRPRLYPNPCPEQPSSFTGTDPSSPMEAALILQGVRGNNFPYSELCRRHLQPCAVSQVVPAQNGNGLPIIVVLKFLSELQRIILLAIFIFCSLVF